MDEGHPQDFHIGVAVRDDGPSMMALKWAIREFANEEMTPHLLFTLIHVVSDVTNARGKWIRVSEADPSSVATHVCDRVLPFLEGLQDVCDEAQVASSIEVVKNDLRPEAIVEAAMRLNVGILVLGGSPNTTTWGTIAYCTAPGKQPPDCIVISVVNDRKVKEVSGNGELLLGAPSHSFAPSSVLGVIESEAEGGSAPSSFSHSPNGSAQFGMTGLLPIGPSHANPGSVARREKWKNRGGKRMTSSSSSGGKSSGSEKASSEDEPESLPFDLAAGIPIIDNDEDDDDLPSPSFKSGMDAPLFSSSSGSNADYYSKPNIQKGGLRNTEPSMPTIESSPALSPARSPVGSTTEVSDELAVELKKHVIAREEALMEGEEEETEEEREVEMMNERQRLMEKERDLETVTREYGELSDNSNSLRTIGGFGAATEGSGDSHVGTQNEPLASVSSGDQLDSHDQFAERKFTSSSALGQEHERNELDEDEEARAYLGNDAGPVPLPHAMPKAVPEAVPGSEAEITGEKDEPQYPVLSMLVAEAERKEHAHGSEAPDDGPALRSLPISQEDPALGEGTAFGDASGKKASVVKELAVDEGLKGEGESDLIGSLDRNGETEEAPDSVRQDQSLPIRTSSQRGEEETEGEMPATGVSAMGAREINSVSTVVTPHLEQRETGEGAAVSAALADSTAESEGLDEVRDDVKRSVDVEQGANSEGADGSDDRPDTQADVAVSHTEDVRVRSFAPDVGVIEDETMTMTGAEVLKQEVATTAGYDEMSVSETGGVTAAETTAAESAAATTASAETAAVDDGLTPLQRARLAYKTTNPGGSFARTGPPSRPMAPVAHGEKAGSGKMNPKAGPAKAGSAKLGSAKLGSAKIGSAKLGSAKLGSGRMASEKLGSGKLPSAKVGSGRKEAKNVEAEERGGDSERESDEPESKVELVLPTTQQSTRAARMSGQLVARANMPTSMGGRGKMDRKAKEEAELAVGHKIRESQGQRNVPLLVPRVKTDFKVYGMKELQEAMDHFFPNHVLGEGSYGIVYAGMLEGEKVAIKQLKNPDHNASMEEIDRELEVQKRCSHPNLVRLLGYSIEDRSLVYEYLSNGSVEDRLLCMGGTPPLLWPDRCRIAMELAAALHHLHTRDPPIVHRDVKPANVLLDDHFVAKLGDVGLARLMEDMANGNTHIVRKSVIVGTEHYVDPEYLCARRGYLGPKSDVYSFGIVLLQLLVGGIPNLRKIDMAVEQENLGALLDPRAGDFPVLLAMDMANLGLWCSEMDRKDRPDLEDEVIPALLEICEAAAQEVVESERRKEKAVAEAKAKEEALRLAREEAEQLKIAEENKRKADEEENKRRAEQKLAGERKRRAEEEAAVAAEIAEKAAAKARDEARLAAEAATALAAEKKAKDQAYGVDADGAAPAGPEPVKPKAAPPVPAAAPPTEKAQGGCGCSIM